MAGLLVAKLGGRLAASPEALGRVARDAARLAGEGWRLVLVHGGGDLVSEYSRRLGVEPRIVVSPSGVRSRYTTLEELEVYTMVMAGLLNKRLAAALQAAGLRALGVSGVDCGLLRAARKERIVILNERGRPQVVPGGYTGRITSVDTRCLQALLGAAEVLAVAPLALGPGGTLLNVNGDQAAAAIASAAGASALVFLTDAPGVVLDGAVLGEVGRGELEGVIGRVGQGMRVKLIMASRALDGGVPLVVVGDGRVEEPLSRALAGSNGTLIRGGP
ncbi:MAG: [LysW]-aminoadipate/[LysW]-glutamate kinase [Desulfurococcales archaeon]|nr:[LysW]-aminoadipate/[LysW]-glutamate kinase [Desulfurococcales archaeon]